MIQPLLMGKPPPHLFLHCDASRSVYTLQMEGENWRKEFKSVQDAVLYAAAIIKEDTPITMLNELGVAFLERVVHSKS